MQRAAASDKRCTPAREELASVKTAAKTSRAWRRPLKSSPETRRGHCGKTRARKKKNGLMPTRADHCTYVHYGKQLPKPALVSEKKSGTTFDLEGAVDYLMDPVSSKNRQVHGAPSLHVDDLLMTRDDVLEMKIMGRLRKDFFFARLFPSIASETPAGTDQHPRRVRGKQLSRARAGGSRPHPRRA